MINPMAIFMAKVKTAIMKKQMAAANPQARGFYRSGDYVRPSVFYNHGSRTFLKNKRKGL